MALNDGLILSSNAAPAVRLVRPPDPADGLRVLLTVIDGRIVVDFGRPIQWAAFTAAEAEALIRQLAEAVRTARTIHVVED